MPEGWLTLVALIATSVATYPVVIVLRRRQVLDVPNARSSHTESTPRGGGIAVMVGLAAGVAVAGAPWELAALLLTALAAATVGFVDDLRDLSAKLRLGLQAALSAVAAVVVLSSAGLTPATYAVMASASVVWLIAYTNAFNFMDGINGISGVSGALAGGWFTVLGIQGSHEVLALGGAVLVGACLGFLPWNAPRARVFLGDVGSYGLGLFIGSLALKAVADGIAPHVAVAPLLVYAADTTWTLARRVLRRESWTQAHREHVYQRLCDCGLSHIQTTALVGAVTLGVCACLLWLPPLVAVLGVAGLLVFYLAMPGVASGVAGRRHALPHDL